MQSRKLLALTSALLSVASYFLMQSVYRTADAAARSSAPSVGRTNSGVEYLFVYVGSASCAPSNEASLPGRVGGLLAAVRGQATRAGVSVRAIGISNDQDPTEGLGHLAKYGQFDELSVGGGALNSAVLRYTADTAGKIATPQVMVVERTFARVAGVAEVLDERMLLRKVGLYELEQWAVTGAEVPGTNGDQRSRDIAKGIGREPSGRMAVTSGRDDNGGAS